ncbi:uncharacterized protein EI90DRAFT_3119566 [Cantharellus anzutake]|uniref:uncharacterized protein n=1 Tax=Cantharellus anzutake TaxID=1750568 RepID=UPI0019037B2A|nr:uncharacterized protein EI90DRAFT_3119566 [Cantharellus anzutake]KAF8336298.1 hypothetical protein EI90DRAFT_3119566 [Cantharellus anzutake]
MCALHILNGTAVVTSNKLESFIPVVAEIPEPPPGYARSGEPTHIIEKNWNSLIYPLLDVLTYHWLGLPLSEDSMYIGAYAAQHGMSKLSEQLSLFTAAYVAMLDRYWQMEYESQAPIDSLSWKPLQAIVYGSKQVLSARFTIHTIPLYFGCLSALLIGVSSAVTLQNTFNRKGIMTKEAGILHSIQMLQWSSLPHLLNKHQSLPESSADGCRVGRDILLLDVQPPPTSPPESYPTAAIPILTFGPGNTPPSTPHATSTPPSLSSPISIRSNTHLGPNTAPLATLLLRSSFTTPPPSRHPPTLPPSAPILTFGPDNSRFRHSFSLTSLLPLVLFR